MAKMLYKFSIIFCAKDKSDFVSVNNVNFMCLYTFFQC